MSSALLMPFGYPLPGNVTNATWLTLSTVNLDATTDKAGALFQALSADAITHIGFRCGSITGTPPTYKIGLQGVGTTGLPDGTYKGGGSPASATFTPSGAGGYGTGTWHWIALDNGYTPSRGEVLTIVVEYSSGSVDASNYMTISYALNNGTTTPSRTFPQLESSTGTWSRAPQCDVILFGLKSTSTVLPTGDMRPLETVATVNAIQATNEAGMAFTVPAGWGDTYKVIGIRFMARGMTNASNFVLTLYSSPTSSPSVLQQTEFDSDAFGSSNTVGVGFLAFDETTLSTLTCGTEYGIGLVCRDVSTDMALYYLGVDAAEDWDAWPFGQQCSWIARTLSTSYTSSGTVPNETTNFTKTTTRRPIMEIVLNDFTEPAGGGGGGLAANPIRGFVG